MQLSSAIQRNWGLPPGTDINLRAYVKIQITTTGEVVSAIIRSSSGDKKFDASVVQALYRASPVHLPRNPSVFEPNITLCFAENPQNCQ